MPERCLPGRNILIVLAGLLGMLAGASNQVLAADKKDAPNIVIMMADDKY